MNAQAINPRFFCAILAPMSRPSRWATLSTTHVARRQAAPLR